MWAFLVLGVFLGKAPFRQVWQSFAMAKRYCRIGRLKNKFHVGGSPVWQNGKRLPYY
jgi:hypothetical protein